MQLIHPFPRHALMKKPHTYLLAFLFTFLLISERTRGGHLLDVSISYTHITGNQYQVTARQYRDCIGLPAMNTLSVCLYSNSNAYSTTLILPQISAVALPPFPYIPQGVSSCSGGTMFGVEKVIYSDTITIPFAANDWIFACSLEGIASLTNSNQKIFGGTHMDNLNYPGNSSPSFVYDPLFMYCVGAPSWENYFATDADGDSLLYSIVPMLVDTLLCPNQPYADPSLIGMNPMNAIPIYMDPDAGWITFTMNQVSYGTLTIMVEEIRNGITIGTTKQLQIFYHVSNCTVLGTSESLPDASITAYPSPAQNEVFVEWNQPSAAGTLICSGLDGKEVLRAEIPAGQQTFRIDASTFASGIYSVRFFGDDGIQSLRFLKW
jgi:hypothetical protein